MNEPVVEISWNERQLCDISLKEFSDSIKTSQFQDPKKKSSSNYKKFVDTHDAHSRKSSFGRIIRKSSDSSTYSYEFIISAKQFPTL